MLLKRSCIMVCCWLAAVNCFAQKDSLTIENATIARSFLFAKDSAGFVTTAFINKASGQNYANPGTEEFHVSINGQTISGKDCRYISHTLSREGDTTTLLVTLQSPLKQVQIQLHYKVYAALALVRKYLAVVNNSSSVLRLSDLDVEYMNFQVVDKYMNEVYANYGSFLTRLPYKGDYNDAAVMVYNLAAKQGVVIGNEAPGVLKQTSVYTSRHGLLQVGMRHSDEAFPFAVDVQPGGLFMSPGTFIYAFNAAAWQQGFEGGYATFMQKYCGVRIMAVQDKPMMMYNTWQPFLENINEALLMECADKMAAAGVDLFMIDAGWYKHLGDYNVDSAKFPQGIRYVTDYIRSKGMKVGLWFSAASVHSKSKVAQEHPEWLVKNRQLENTNIHDMSVAHDTAGPVGAQRSASLGSPYYDHLKSVISSYVRDLQLSYIKLDLSIATSAYVHDPGRSGDYGFNSSKQYTDHATSYYSSYQRMMQLMDELHALFPGLLIDCTFEVWGRYNVIDYALMQHADYDWIVNVDVAPPTGPVAVRQMLFDRSLAVPPAAMLIGNMRVDFANYQYVYLSTAASNIILLGDPRKLNNEQLSFYKKWNDWLKQSDKKYHYTRYFQPLAVFDRPGNNNWDGCSRINPDMQGGLLFIFRNNSPDTKRNVLIPGLDSTARYRIYSFEQDKTLGVFSGSLLMQSGLPVNIPNRYQAVVLELTKQ